MSFFTTDALVLREVRYKEADRILTLFTADRGIITAKARAALRKNSKLSAATQQLTLSDMTVFENKGKCTVQEATVKEPFEGLRRNFEDFALGCYFAECMETLVQENEPDPLSLQLILNALYALSHELCEVPVIKAVFELRLMMLMGYTPELASCSICGKPRPENPVLGLQSGHICCRTCRNEDFGQAVYLDDASLEAMRFVLSAPPKQIFSFRLEKSALNRLCDASELYLTTQLGRRFSTLEYWKKLRK